MIAIDDAREAFARSSRKPGLFHIASGERTMRSMRGAATAAFLTCIAAMTLGTTASADLSSGAKLQPAKDSTDQGAKPAEPKRVHEDMFYYQFDTPAKIWEYDRNNGACRMPNKTAPVSVFRATAAGVTLSLTKEPQPKEPQPKEFRVVDVLRKTRFIIVRTIGDKTDPQLVIRICKDDWRGSLVGSCGWDPDRPDWSDQAQNGTYIKNEQSQFDKYYCIDKSEFDSMLADSYIDKKYIRAQVDPVYGLNFTLPIKVRRAIPGFNTMVDKDIQIGGFLGARWRISDSSDYYIDLPVVSAGLTTLTIAKGTATSAMEGSKETMGITASTGIIIELSDFQLGIMMGVDRATGDTGRGWRYNGKPWYSFGFGYSFLKNK